MPGLLPRAFSRVLNAYALGATLALLAASSRVLPAIMAPGASPQVSLVFLQAVLEPILQAALLIAGPVGMASMPFSRRAAGSSRAVGPVVAVLLCELMLCVPFVVFVGAWQPEKAARTAQELIKLSRRECVEATRPESVSVPVIGLVWLCTPGRAPKLVGGPPTARRTVWFSADHVWLSEDGTQIGARDVRLAFLGRSSQIPRTTVHVHKVNVTRFGTLSQPTAGQDWLGALTAALCALLNTALVGFLSLRTERGRMNTQAFCWVSGLGAALWVQLLSANFQTGARRALPLAASLGFTLGLWLIFQGVGRIRHPRRSPTSQPNS